MSARSYHTSKPIAVNADKTVYWQDGQEGPLDSLKRPDLLKVAGAIAKTHGEKVSVSWDGPRLRAYIANHAPWTAGDDVPEPDGKPEPDEDAPDGDRVATPVVCSCGHTFTYKIRRNRLKSTKKWLESKPCPKCSKDKGNKRTPNGEPNTPEDAPEIEEDDDEGLEEVPEPKATPRPEVKVELDLDELADRLVGKVMERLSPVQLPEVHHKDLPEILKLVQQGHVWLYGPPGTGKTTLARQVADALGRPFHFIQCFEQMDSVDLFGYRDVHGKENRTSFWDAYEHGGVFLCDELDNGNSNLTAGLNGALDNSHCMFAGRSVERHKDFICVAAANTLGNGPERGFLGRYGVDRATKDRFLADYFLGIDDKLEAVVVESILGKSTESSSVLKAVRALRKTVDNRGMDLLVTPRASRDVARMVKVGVPLKRALTLKCLSGVDASTTASLLTDAGVK